MTAFSPVSAPFAPLFPALAPKARAVGRHELLRQARVADELGSPFVAKVLEAAWRQLDAAPALAARIDQWPGDRAAAAMALRLNSGLHALARAAERTGRHASLGALYRDLDGDFDLALAQALAHGEAFLLGWMGQPTQTNEVGRSAAFMGALMELQALAPLPVELLEIGSSAGLNLNLHHYSYRLGGQRYGAALGRVRIAPVWQGRSPPCHALTVTGARGVDLHPLDVANVPERERLMAYVWPGDRRRARRLQAAIAVAQDYPPRIEHGQAGAWLAARLQAPQAAGTWRVLMHSMVMQYIAPAEQQAIKERLRAAGQAASADAPLAVIGYEWREDRSAVELTLTDWRGGEPQSRLLAICHPYGHKVEWLG